jgi:hypothetical protein
MPPPDQLRREYVRRQRRSALIWGPVIAVVNGLLVFCLVVPTVALLNVVVPHLPWVPPDRPVEPPVATAWVCAKVATVTMLGVSAFFFILIPGKPPPSRPGEV